MSHAQALHPPGLSSSMMAVRFPCEPLKQNILLCCALSFDNCRADMRLCRKHFLPEVFEACSSNVQKGCHVTLLGFFSPIISIVCRLWRHLLINKTSIPNLGYNKCLLLNIVYSLMMNLGNLECHLDSPFQKRESIYFGFKKAFACIHKPPYD